MHSTELDAAAEIHEFISRDAVALVVQVLDDPLAEGARLDEVCWPTSNGW
jgi:hypothetical protein